MINTIFNIIAVCGVAGFAGFLLCIGATFGSYWRSLSPEAFLDWFAVNNHFIANAVPLVAFPTLIGLVGSVWLSWNTSSFLIWLASALCFVGVFVLTFVYFAPTNAAFASRSIEGAAATAKLNQWLMVHYARIGLAVGAAILGCIAIKA